MKHTISIALLTCCWVMTACDKQPPAPPEKPRVWIEFENVQHGLDAAGKLGGTARGLTVCVHGNLGDERVWMPPGVAMSGKDCAFQPPAQRKEDVE